MNSQKITIRFPKPSDLETVNLEYLANLINKVYDVAEEGMWKNNAQRIKKSELKKLLENKNLLLAELDNKIVGCVNINLFDKNIAEFGMLVADPDFRNVGIGRELVKKAELWALENNRKIMRLEILVPKNWLHPSKEFLKTWYARIGYVLHSTEPFENLHPDKVDKLATPCDFTVYHKNLRK